MTVKIKTDIALYADRLNYVDKLPKYASHWRELSTGSPDQWANIYDTVVSCPGFLGFSFADDVMSDDGTIPLRMYSVYAVFDSESNAVFARMSI